MVVQYFFDVIGFNEGVEDREVVFSVEFVVLLCFVLANDQHLVPRLDRVDQVVQYDHFTLARDAAGFHAVGRFLDVDLLEVALLAHVFHHPELPFVAVRALA